MQISQMVVTYQGGNVTVEEFREELALYWDKKIYKGTKTPVMERRSVTRTAIPRGRVDRRNR